MSEYLGNAVFHHGTLLNIFAKNNWVFPSHSVYLLNNFDVDDVVHELGHVFENNTSNSICLPTWFGGGAADDLIRFIEGSASGIRWANGSNGIPPNYLWDPKSSNSDVVYGNHSTADYFATAFEFAVLNQSEMPGPNGEVAIWFNIFIAMQTAKLLSH